MALDLLASLALKIQTTRLAKSSQQCRNPPTNRTSGKRVNFKGKPGSPKWHGGGITLCKFSSKLGNSAYEGWARRGAECQANYSDVQQEQGGAMCLIPGTQAASPSLCQLLLLHFASVLPLLLTLMPSCLSCLFILSLYASLWLQQQPLIFLPPTLGFVDFPYDLNTNIYPLAFLRSSDIEMPLAWN